MQLHEPKLPDDEDIVVKNNKGKFPSIAGSIDKNLKIDTAFTLNFMNCIFGNIHFQGNKNRTFGHLLRVSADKSMGEIFTIDY